MTTTIIFYQCEAPNINTYRANTCNEKHFVAVGNGGEIIGKNQNAIDKQLDFLACPSCFWCATYFNFNSSSIVRCPLCHNDNIDQLPVAIDKVRRYCLEYGKRWQNEM